MKPLLVGELNPHGNDAVLALWPGPRGCAGDRLCRVVLGMRPADYLRAFDRANLCEDAWDLAAARRRADVLCGEYPPGTRFYNHARWFVLLGARVCRAFGRDFVPFSVDDRDQVVVLPHPSGRCHLWNDPLSVRRARAAVRVTGVAC